MSRPPQRAHLKKYVVADKSLATKVQKLKRRLRAFQKGSLSGEVVGIVIEHEKGKKAAVKFSFWSREGLVETFVSRSQVKTMLEYVSSLGFGEVKLTDGDKTFIPASMIKCQFCEVPTVFAGMDEEVEWRKCLRCGGLLVLED